MTTVDLGALLAQAEAAGLTTGNSEKLPDGDYNFVITHVKPGASNGGKIQVGIRIRVLDGPFAGKATWLNQTLTATPEAAPVFARIMQSFGVPPEALAGNVTSESIAAYVVVGTTGNIKLTLTQNGDYLNQNVKAVKLIPGLQAAPSAAIPAAPVAPVVAAPPVAVAYTTPPVAPAAAAPVAVPVVAAPVVAAPVATPVAAVPVPQAPVAVPAPAPQVVAVPAPGEPF